MHYSAYPQTEIKNNQEKVALFQYSSTFTPFLFMQFIKVIILTFRY